jgi:hypothetical protein
MWNESTYQLNGSSCIEKWNRDYFKQFGGKIKTTRAERTNWVKLIADEIRVAVSTYLKWSQLSDLNRRPTVYKTVALPLS